MGKVEIDVEYVTKIIKNALHYAAFGFEDKAHKYFYMNALEVLCGTKIINEIEYNNVLAKIKKAKIKY